MIPGGNASKVPADYPGLHDLTFMELVDKYGLSAAVALLPLLSSQSSDASKGLAGARLGVTGLNAANDSTGALAGTAVGGALPYAQGALKAAGLGLSLADIAKNENLSNKQKVGHSVDSTVAATVWPYGLAKLADSIFAKLSSSNSPQVSGLGKSLNAPALPIQGLMSVLRGDRSPRAAANAVVRSIGDVPVLGGPMGSVMRAFGLGTKPTTGTDFRRQVDQLFGRIPELRNTDTSKYNMAGGVDAYNAFSPEARSGAESIARQLGPLSPVFAKQDAARQQAYIGQIANILLNNYGNKLPTVG